MKSELKELKTNEAEISREVTIQKHQLLISESEYRAINTFLDNPDTTYEGGSAIIDWNFTMKLVEKIESLGYGFHKTPFDLDIVEYLSGNENKIIAFQDDPEMKLIDKWYYVVFEFIKWHNQQKQ